MSVLGVISELWGMVVAGVVFLGGGGGGFCGWWQLFLCVGIHLQSVMVCIVMGGY